MLIALRKVPWEFSLRLLESVLFCPLGHTGEQFLQQQEDQHSRTCGIKCKKASAQHCPHLELDFSLLEHVAACLLSFYYAPSFSPISSASLALSVLDIKD